MSATPCCSSSSRTSGRCDRVRVIPAQAGIQAIEKNHGSTAGSSSTSRSGSARPRRSSAIKRILREAGEPKTKVGHGGTLDPLASGVLPIALGEATKVAGRMLGATKGYDFTIRFGEETDTLDAEGQIVATSDVRPTLDEIETVLAALHRRDRAGPAGLFCAENRRQARLRTRPRRRRRSRWSRDRSRSMTLHSSPPRRRGSRFTSRDSGIRCAE